MQNWEFPMQANAELDNAALYSLLLLKMYTNGCKQSQGDQHKQYMQRFYINSKRSGDMLYGFSHPVLFPGNICLGKVDSMAYSVYLKRQVSHFHTFSLAAR